MPGHIEYREHDFRNEVNVLGSFRSNLETEEDITMGVDYATGEQPPGGVVVRSQAEYDALAATLTGGKLKYCNDALTILPTVVKHSIYVDVAAGVQYAPDDDLYGDLGDAFIVSPLLIGPFGITVDNITYAKAIVVFRGARNTIESSISGTFAGKVFTRDSGTWTTDELKGKHIEVSSGAGAGNIYLVRTNDTTTATVVKEPTAGAAVIESFDHATTLDSRVNGGSQAARGIVSASDISSIPLLFEDLNIGTPTNQLTGIFVFNQQFVFNRCVIYSAYGVQLVPQLGKGAKLDVRDSYFGTCDSGITSYGGYAQFQYCFFDMNKWAIYSEYSPSRIVLYGNYFDAGSYTGAILELKKSASVHGNIAVNIIEGNGSCTGILLNESDPMSNPQYFQVDDCGVAMKVSGGRVTIPNAVSGSGNTKAWEVTKASRLVVNSPASLAGTTEVDVDGTTYTYSSDLPSVGSEIIGSLKSSMVRI